ncbi:2,5-diketo-D-gluconate reductase [Bacillus sp. TS-2]|nr:2,5-diketo-D-gluconate reductase [Bacillus sp. TS-2]
MEVKIPTIDLNDGHVIPAVGLGTVQLKGEAGVNSLLTGLNAGYRLLDSAYNYENEGTIGEAVKRTHLPREQLYITSKLPGRYQPYSKALTTVEESLFRASLDYYDLYLIHWPNPITDQYVEAWQALIEAQKRGNIRSIGVCNFLPEHLDRIMKETGIKPAINQIELHPFFNQENQREYHKQHNIQTQSWSPLVRSKEGSELFENKQLQELANKYQKSLAQIVLRWHYQLDSIAIPKSGNANRQKENLSIFNFELQEQEMEIISSLTREDGRLHKQDPATYEEF